VGFRVNGRRPNKEMDQTNGAQARMEAPFAGHLRRYPDYGEEGAP
jgi:hypothetical protein